MKRILIGLAVAVCFVSVSAYGWSQLGATRRGPDERGRHPFGSRPPHPILKIFDHDQDGQLSEEEVAGSADYLASLDANQDGVVSDRELPKPPKGGQGGAAYDPEGGQCEECESVSVGSERRTREDRGREARVMADSDETQLDAGSVSVTSGHVTDSRDGGRPIVLIAAALGVKEEVFRKAFSEVSPSKGGPPSASRARENKEKLMAVLEPYGVTSERLDEVSNFYRYRPEDGGLWKHRPAKAKAVIEDGKLVSVKVIDGGSGYTTAPTVRVIGQDSIRFESKIAFGQKLSNNGKLVAIEPVE